jgi:hypothetical protein
MGKPYSVDLRERVVAAVETGGLSCHRAAAQFGVGVSTAINWVRRLRETGSVAPGQMGAGTSRSSHDPIATARWGVVSPACSLSDISGWRDGVLYPLAGRAERPARAAWVAQRLLVDVATSF